MFVLVRERERENTCGADLSVPDVDTLVEGAAGEVSAVRTEGHAVHGLLVASQRVDAHPALHVPQTHR